MVLAGALGFAFAVVSLGDRAWSPSSMQHFDSDRMTHLLGWRFFQADQWRWPGGASPRYGDSAMVGILFTDSLPIAAVPLKALVRATGIGERPFHPFNLWVGLSFALQAASGWSLGRALRLTPQWRSVLCVVLVTAPVFVIRAQVHIALSSHWIILVAIAFFAQEVNGQPRRAVAWPLLLGAAVWTQPYFVPIVGCVWLGSLMQRWTQRRSARSLPIELALVAVTALASLHQLGGESVAGSGLGELGFDLASPFDPDQFSSVLLPDLASTGFETFSFLGLGTLMCLPLLLRRSRSLLRGPWRYFALAVLVCTLLATGGRVVINGHLVWSPPIPRRVDDALSIFRSSDRFAWLLV